MQASANATEAALSLGLNLPAFTGPVQTGTTVLGTDAYHWERLSSGTPVERVTYLREDQRLCWSALSAGAWQDKGCINTRTYEP
jgi:hypothetical protein